MRAGKLSQPETGGTDEPAGTKTVLDLETPSAGGMETVKANQGAAGVDEESIKDFEQKTGSRRAKRSRLRHQSAEHPVSTEAEWTLLLARAAMWFGLTKMM
jgi:hypothetical protein